MKKKQIAILGSTGSIGTQALQVIEEHSDLYEVYCLTANNRVELLAEQAHRFHPAAIVIANEARYDELKRLTDDIPDVKVYAGAQAINEIVEAKPIDIVLTAMVGFAGLTPTIHAIKARKTIALANKETLVVAGELIGNLATQYHAPILPVDSEHSAIFQSLVGEDVNRIDKILLTASGGPFRNFTIEQLAQVSKADALRHPTWDMGAKITIDSASMMNKGFEVIEAKWLFGVKASQIQVLVHPQSIVHSAVQFDDGAVKAQLGVPDMRLPKYCHSWSRCGGVLCRAKDAGIVSRCVGGAFRGPGPPAEEGCHNWRWPLQPYQLVPAGNRLARGVPQRPSVDEAPHALVEPVGHHVVV